MPKFSFKADTSKLKNWLGKRKASLKAARQPMEALWLEVRKHYEPFLGKALLEGDPDQRAAQREDEAILNTEPRILLHRMAAGLQSGITNQARQWFRLSTHDKKLAEMRAVRQWLDQATETVQAAMNRSNVYAALDQIYMHLGIGTAAALCVPDSENGLHMHIIDEGAYWISENRRGRVETLMRRVDMTIRTLIDEFGEGWIPDQIKQRADSGRLEERVIVWNLVCRNDPDRFPDIEKDRQFVSVYWLDGQPDPNNGIIAIRSFDYNPIIAPRWSVFGSAYGIGCGIIGLADAKQLQRLELDKLKLVALEVDPPMQADASMKGEPINTGPGGLTFGTQQGLGQGKAPAVTRLFETRQQIQAVLMTIQDIEKRLGRTFFSDLFSMMLNLNMQPKQMTAREVNELSAEKVALLGPILTRLNTDLLDPLVDAVFALCLENGDLPQPPPDLEGVKLKIEYVSSLHVEQMSATRMSGLFKLAEFVGMLSPYKPDVVDKVDFDEMIDIAAQSLVEHGVVLDDKDVQVIREVRARQQQQAAQAEQMTKAAPAMAGAAKDLSQTEMGKGSALDGLMGAMQ